MKNQKTDRSGFSFNNCPKFLKKHRGLSLGVLVLVIGALAINPILNWNNLETNATQVQPTAGTACSVGPTFCANTATSGTTISATLSPAASANDLIVAVVGANGNTTINAPAGFSTAINQSGAGTVSQGVFYKKATGGETTISATVSSNPGSISIQLYEFNNAINTLDGTNSNTGNSSTPSTNSITTTSANDLIIAAYTTDKNTNFSDTSWNDVAGEGFTEVNDFKTTGPGHNAAYGSGVNLTNSIGSNSSAVTLGAGGLWRGQIVAFKAVTPAAVTNVTSTLGNGSYKAGQLIPIQISFNQNVTVTGTPQLSLNDSGGIASYFSGSGTSVLTFNYTVGAGENTNDLDYASTAALNLNGGSIKDGSSVDATLTLPTPGAAGSLGANKNIVIDTVSPTVAEVTPVTTPTNDNTPSYTFTTSEAGTIGYAGSCSGPASATSGSNTISLGPLSDNTYNCTLTVTDAAGNVSNTLTVTSFIVDTSAPTVTQVTAVPSPTGDNTPDYTFNSNEAGTITYGGDCSSATTAAASGNNTVTFNTLADGSHSNCTVTVTDAAGNPSSALAVNTFTVDTTGPTLTEVTPVATPTNDNTPNYTFNSNEAGTITYGGSCSSTTTAASSGNNTVTLDTPTTHLPLADATYNDCTVTVTDAAGNPSLALSITAFTVNTTPPAGPTLTEVTPVPNPTSDTTPNYTFNSTDAGAITYGGDCSSATTTAVAGSNTITFNTLSEATHSNCTILVTDGSSNPSNLLAVSSFRIDTTAPTVTQVTAVPNPAGTHTPSYTFNTTEAGTITYGGGCSSATTAAVSGSNTITFNTLADGVYNSCTITVTDAAGNPSSVLTINAFTVDTTAPTISENTAVATPGNNAAPIYKFNSNEAGTITYGGDCSSVITSAINGVNTITFNTLADGTHNNCTITVTDAAGNPSNTLNVSTFVIDTNAPSDVTDLATSGATAGSMNLVWTAPGNNGAVGTAASYEVRYSTSNITPANFTSATLAIGIPVPQVSGSPETMTVLSLNPSTTYYFALIAVDAANNVSNLSNVASGTTLALPPLPPLPPAPTPTSTETEKPGVGALSGWGNKPCVGASCAGSNKDYLKMITNQGNQGQTLHSAANANQTCGRDQTTPVNFSDIVNDPNRAYIENLYRRCIVDGRTQEKFVPEDTITRAEFLKIVLNIFNLGTSTYMDSFSDIRANDWSAKYVAKALELKLIELADKFYPDRPVSRAEALKIVLLAKNVPDLEGYHAHYLDSSTDDWFYHYAAYAHAHNLFGVTSRELSRSGLISNFYAFPGTLKTGDSGLKVNELKDALKQLGYYDGDTSGLYDYALSKSVSKFQLMHGLKQNGNLDEATRKALLKQEVTIKEIRYFIPDKPLTRSELAALISKVER